MENESATLLGEKNYQRAKFTALIVLPALASLYFGLAKLWGLPNTEEVVGTITVFDTFLGVLLGLSTAQYNRSGAKYDGDMNGEVTEDGRVTYTLVLKKEAEDLTAQSDVTFKVNNPSLPPRPHPRPKPRTSETP